MQGLRGKFLLEGHQCWSKKGMQGFMLTLAGSLSCSAGREGLQGLGVNSFGEIPQGVCSSAGRGENGGVF